MFFNRKLISRMAAFAFVCLTASVAFAEEAPHSQPGDELFIQHTIELRGYSIPYSIFISTSLDRASAPPVILAFHGSGERGSDGLKNTRVGIGATLRAYPELYPAIVVLPQLPIDKNWPDKMDPSNPDSPTVEDLALAAMETTLQNYSADRSRLYVTGNSLGGFATYELAAAHPHLFAAALPISGGGDIALAEKLKSIPIWAAHGLWDQDVKLKFDWNLYQAIKKTGNQQMHFSLHLLKMHNVWDVTYKNKKIVRWLLEQKLSI